MKLRRILGIASLGLLAAVWKAPQPTVQGPQISQLVEDLDATDLRGAELVNAAIRRVAEAYPVHSAWHIWETPEVSVQHGRGWSYQYNVTLHQVLRGLGCTTRLVHAPWVRGGGYPWWRNSHVWVKVLLDGRWQDACASDPRNQVGDLPVIPTTPELPVRRWTIPLVSCFVAPFVAYQVWKSWLTGEDIPEWIYTESTPR